MNKIVFVAIGLIFAINAYAQDVQVAVMTDVEKQAPVMDEEDLGFDLTEDAFGNELVPDLEVEAPRPKVDASKSLSQNLKHNAKASETKEDKKEKEKSSSSWVGNLFKGNAKKSDEVKKLMEESQNRPRRSNAAVFNIAGVMLKMS